MRVARIAAIAALTVGGMLASPIGVKAQGEGPAMENMFFAAQTMSGPGCPMVHWSLHGIGAANSGAFGGAVWYGDMSGFSNARGMIGKDGKFTAQVTPVSGAGPTGTITGTRAANGELVGSLNGAGCSRLEVRMRQMPMVTPGSG